MFVDFIQNIRALIAMLARHGRRIRLLYCVIVLIVIFIVSKRNNKLLNGHDKEKSSKPHTYKYKIPLYIIQEYVRNTRSKLQYQLSFYNFSRNLEDLVMESGGQPLRSLIISTWKSGTTFLGELLNAIPGSYYFYEPLLMYGIRQIREPPEADLALNTIKALLKCNYETLKDYLEYARESVVQFRYNIRIWHHCKFMKHLCCDSEFMSQLCKLFPFQVMKVVRLRLKPIQEILDDKEKITILSDSTWPFNSMLGRRFTFLLMCFISGFGFLIIIIILARSRCGLTESRYIKLLISKQVGGDKNFVPKFSSPFDNDPYYTRIFDETRSNIKYKLSGYNVLLNGVRYKLKDLVMESGGRPMRSLIISTWKSGTTFLGEILNAIPGTFYHYEPLLSYGIIQIRGPPEADQALNTLRAMLKCNYDGLEDYFEYGRKHRNQFSHNIRLWDHCRYKKELCYDAEFTSRLCKLFPFHTMKVVRLRLLLIRELLRDKELNLKLILLIRDPRGMMQSRRHIKFCDNKPDCNDPTRVCHDMLSDYMAASVLLQEYPERLMIIRFEELAMDPYNISMKILKFLGHTVTKPIYEYLNRHTNHTESLSTYRISSTVPFKWKTALNFEAVNEVQMACKIAMEKWGYKLAFNETHMKSKDFNPLQDYTIAQ